MSKTTFTMSMYTQIMFSRYFKNILKLQSDLDPELEKLSEHWAWGVQENDLGVSDCTI